MKTNKWNKYSNERVLYTQSGARVTRRRTRRTSRPGTLEWEIVMLVVFALLVITVLLALTGINPIIILRMVAGI